MKTFRNFSKILIVLIFSTFYLSSCSNNLFGGAKKDDASKVTIYFTKASKELGVVLIPVTRKIPAGKNAYETALNELFLGPTLEEKEKLELNTEIPEGSRLVKVQENEKEILIDISSQFMSGGGSESMQVRFRQLRETILTQAKGRPVYLLIDGERVKTIGGEGVEVPQPLGKKLN
jgi:spore germination protein GerM